MLSLLRKHWLFLLAILLLLFAVLIILCWQAYIHNRLVIYPLVSLYDYTDAGTHSGNSSNATSVVLLLLLVCTCLLFFWLRNRRATQPRRTALLVFALFFLVIALPWTAWLAFGSLSLKTSGLSGTEERQGHVSYWHVLSLSNGADNSEPDMVREHFQCDDRQLICTFSSREPYGP